MSDIGYIKIPLLKEGHFALIPYDKVERKLLGEEAFIDLLDKKIKLHLAELTTEAIKDEKEVQAMLSDAWIREVE